MLLCPYNPPRYSHTAVFPDSVRACRPPLCVPEKSVICVVPRSSPFRVSPVRRLNQGDIRAAMLACSKQLGSHMRAPLGCIFNGLNTTLVTGADKSKHRNNRNPARVQPLLPLFIHQHTTPRHGNAPVCPRFLASSPQRPLTTVATSRSPLRTARGLALSVHTLLVPPLCVRVSYILAASCVRLLARAPIPARATTATRPSI